MSPIGRAKTGATEIIRENLGELLRLRGEGASWSELAASLASQGVTQGDDEPLTGRRLTALINNIKARDAKLMEKASRSGHAPAAASAPRARKHAPVRLSSEMQKPVSSELPLASVDEQELRVAELERHAHLLKRK